MSRDASLSGVGEIPDMLLGLSGISVLRQLRYLTSFGISPLWDLASFGISPAPESRRPEISPLPQLT